MAFIEVNKLTRTFKSEHKKTVALDEVSFTLESSHTLAICGPSGSGKSTLLAMLGGLDRPDSGQVLVDGADVTAMSAAEEAAYRNSVTGFVFQFHHLLRDFDVVENVMMPLIIRGESKNSAMQVASEILERVGLASLQNRRPGELSGGEQQRAAIARALVTKPKLILADEPTGNLDEANGRQVFDLLCQLNRDLKCTLVVVTHHEEFARRMEKVLRLKNGRVVSLGNS